MNIQFFYSCTFILNDDGFMKLHTERVPSNWVKTERTEHKNMDG